MTATLPGNNRDQLHALTGTRFFAAFAVVLYHSFFIAYPNLSQLSVPGRAISLGFSSVSFFFLLSGYILAHVYLGASTTVNTRRFYIARIARIYPLFLLTLIADTPNLLVARIIQYGMKSAVLKTSVTFLGSAAMLQAWVPQLGGIDNPNWSLSVETLFYLVFPIAGVWIVRLRPQLLLPLASLLWLANLTVLHAVIHVASDDRLAKMPLLHLATFLIGVMLYQWQRNRRLLSGVSASVVSAESPRMLTALTLFVVIGGAAALYWQPALGHAYPNDGLFDPIYAACILLLSNSRLFIPRLLSTRPIVLLGEASFGLYLIHIPVYHLWEYLQLDRRGDLYPLYLLLCVSLSIISFKWVEIPTRKWILARFHARSRESVLTSSGAQ